ncbi:MAG: glycosyltransferase [Bryobacterales bacterium]|nr:glycosyltransferase [Bryobacterales bacterium]MBV9397679.1 glycosyltransferase [Bryobacterales bacterium]
MTEAPRLLHVFPGFGPGGTQLRMVSIINAMGARFAHRIIALDGVLEAAKAISGSVDATVEGLPKTTGPLAFRALVAGWRPAAVLTYNWGALEGTLGARLAGVPVIHSECGFGTDEAQSLKRRRVWMRRLVLNNIYRTVVTSKTMLNIARREFKLLRHKVQLIPTGVDVEHYRPRNGPAAREGVVFGYLGGLRPEKNLMLLIRSFSKAAVPNSKLILAGEGPCRAELTALVSELGIAGRVEFAGHQADPAAFLRRLDVFAMSSVTEQVSNAQLEAMASGLPVICTDVGDSRELLGESAPGCVAPSNDEPAYTQALRQIGKDPNRRSMLGAANRERTVRCYSKERMVEEYRTLIEGAIVANKRVRAAQPDEEPCTRLESGA